MGRIFLLFSLSLLLRQDGTESVLERVSQTLGSQREDLKYYVCVEEVRFKSWDLHGGKAYGKKAGYEFRVLEDEEIREPLKEKKQTAELPLMSFGGFFSSIYGVLGPENLRLYEFKIRPAGAGETLLEVEVPREKSVSRLQTLDGKDVVFAFKAKIVVDTPTGRIKSFQRTAKRLPGRIKHLEHRVSFALREIDGKTRNMPIEQESLLQQGVRWYSLQHEYSDFRKFVSGAKIRFK